MSQNDKKHILVISQYFYPEQFRINDICTEWVNRGYKVTVITGIPNYPQGKYYGGYGLFKRRKETYNGIEIIRIPLVPRGKKSIMLVLNYLSFVVSGFFWTRFTRIKADMVFVFQLSPMTQALPGVWYAKRWKIPCFLYVQDLWPESFIVLSGIKNRYIYSAVAKMVDYVYLRSTKIFTTSNSFVTSIANRGVPKEKLEYWPQYAEDFYKPLKDVNINEIVNDDAFNIIFAGNIGTSQGLEVLPKTALILKRRQSENNFRICFNIVGDGRYKETLIKLVKENGTEDMFNFIDKQLPTRIPEFIASCNAALICLTDSPLFAMTIPAKLQSYLACGIPIIASANGETQEIIKSSKAGVCSPAGNAEILAENIIDIAIKPSKELFEMARNASNYYGVKFNKSKLLSKMDEYFEHDF